MVLGVGTKLRGSGLSIHIDHQFHMSAHHVSEESKDSRDRRPIQINLILITKHKLFFFFFSRPTACVGTSHILHRTYLIYGSKLLEYHGCVGHRSTTTIASALSIFIFL